MKVFSIKSEVFKALKAKHGDRELWKLEPNQFFDRFKDDLTAYEIEESSIKSFANWKKNHSLTKLGSDIDDDAVSEFSRFLTKDHVFKKILKDKGYDEILRLDPSQFFKDYGHKFPKCVGNFSDSGVKANAYHAFRTWKYRTQKKMENEAPARGDTPIESEDDEASGLEPIVFSNDVPELKEMQDQILDGEFSLLKISAVELFTNGPLKKYYVKTDDGREHAFQVYNNWRKEILYLLYDGSSNLQQEDVGLYKEALELANQKRLKMSAKKKARSKPKKALLQTPKSTQTRFVTSLTGSTKAVPKSVLKASTNMASTSTIEVPKSVLKSSTNTVSMTHGKKKTIQIMSPGATCHDLAVSPSKMPSKKPTSVQKMSTDTRSKESSTTGKEGVLATNATGAASTSSKSVLKTTTDTRSSESTTSRDIALSPSKVLSPSEVPSESVLKTTTNTRSDESMTIRDITLPPSKVLSPSMGPSKTPTSKTPPAVPKTPTNTRSGAAITSKAISGASPTRTASQSSVAISQPRAMARTASAISPATPSALQLHQLHQLQVEDEAYETETNLIAAEDAENAQQQEQGRQDYLACLEAASNNATAVSNATAALSNVHQVRASQTKVKFERLREVNERRIENKRAILAGNGTHLPPSTPSMATANVEGLTVGGTYVGEDSQALRAQTQQEGDLAHMTNSELDDAEDDEDKSADTGMYYHSFFSEIVLISCCRTHHH